MGDEEGTSQAPVLGRVYWVSELFIKSFIRLGFFFLNTCQVPDTEIQQ